MKSMLVMLSLAVVSLVIVSEPLFGHHGTAVFEKKAITMKGTVTEWIWSNPHCLLQFDVKDENGQAVHWTTETPAPINMIPSGWSKESFKPGDEINIAVDPVKGGRPVGQIEWVVLPNGRTLKVRAAVNDGPNAGQ